MYPLVIYSLTTLAKVKTALNITDTNSDQFLTDLINTMSKWAENYTGGRRFLSQQYTEVYDTRQASQKVFLRQRPLTSDNIVGSGNSAITVNYRSGTPTVPLWNLYDPNGYVVYLPEGYIHFYGFLPKVHQGLQVIYTAGYLIGFQQFAITGITGASTTATATVASTANMKTGDQVLIAGSSVAADNAVQTITVVNSTTFTFTTANTTTRSGQMYGVDNSAEFDPTRHTLPEDLTNAITQLCQREYALRYSKGVTLVMTEGQKIQYASKENPVDDDIRNILDSYKTMHYAI